MGVHADASIIGMRRVNHRNAMRCTWGRQAVALTLAALCVCKVCFCTAELLRVCFCTAELLRMPKELRMNERVHTQDSARTRGERENDASTMFAYTVVKTQQTLKRRSRTSFKRRM